MKVVLRNNAIFVQGSSNTLEEEWMEEFFDHHIQNTLFLDNGVLVLNNENSLDKKEEFLEELSGRFTKMHELSDSFYRRSLKRCKTAAVRIEVPYRQSEKVDVELYAYGPDRVEFTFSAQNRWVMRYLRQQLSNLVLSSTPKTLLINVGTPSAKMRLEKTLNRREVLHFTINYRYDDEFMSRLYGNFRGWGFGSDAIDKMIRYHAIFEIPVGTKSEDLKKRYRQLAKRYHPDRVQKQSPEIINKYTEKFQLIQEAYGALRAVS
ncbi:MAG: J domain-containing protein [Sulfuricurvum sp.]|uniref:J domain-containing protein n=1 Tax=Sulfuricurvum sp. TaxID=2025608 RepID=UPI002606E3F1|nr:J domain-containing protein [Sulfuricurvum sp.]MDD2838261.1 J domain-containing protein [Sulfuricurvum sp.]MDD4885012.1 J domain-containing protein [Sulfuricurvum sp.]